MKRTIVTLVSTALLTIGCASHADATTHHAPRPHTACQSEDSSWCVWDARHTGNGIGRSFWTDHAGEPHYVSHKRAHRMLHK